MPAYPLEQRNCGEPKVLYSRFCLIIVFLPLLTGSLPADGSQKKPNNPVAILWSFLSQPDARIDFARAKLTFDKFTDPSIDVAASLKEIDALANAAWAMAGPDAAPLVRLRAVRRVIYVDGDWNGHRPFQYDRTDPLGEKPANRLLSTYLRTRRGNCTSMPVLFMALANRVGVHVTLSIAPDHEFVKYIDDETGKAYNLETTSGGFPARDEWYREKMPMRDEATKSGVYLKTLTRKQSVAVVGEILVEHAMQTRDYRTAIALSNLILKQYPEFAWALIERGVAYSGLIDTEFRPKYARPMDIPEKLVPKYLSYVHESKSSFDKLDALGWRPEEGKDHPTSVAQAEGRQ